MNIYCLTSLFGFIQSAMAYIDIKGELTFDFHPINLNILNNNVGHNKIINEIEILHKKARSSNETTAAVRVDTADKETVKAKTPAKDDCMYKFPEKKQVEALLSDMMNQLTKIFVRAFEYMGRRDARQNGKRFKIVNQKFDSRFFEQAYNMMRKEYRQAINATDISRLSGHDPCHHQSEVKDIWRNLLEHSKAILKRAAVRCVSDFLRVRNRADDSRAKEKVGQLLLREINEVRSNQLKVLCDNFKLCYKDLLH